MRWSNPVIPYRLMMVVFFVATLSYVGLGRAVFKIPTDPVAAAACGFTADDFGSSGQIEYTPTQAWWMSFVREKEYLSAISFGVAIAFCAFAFSAARRVGRAVGSGAVVGGGLAAFATICIGCLAPTVAAFGLGLGVSVFAGLSKWIVLINTLVITTIGTLLLAKRLSACSILEPCSPVNKCAIKE